MKLQQVLSLTRKAIDDYHMINRNDKIAVGISGGKDSLTLLYALSNLRRFYPEPFELVAVTVDLGFDNLNLTKIKELCVELNVDYHIVKTDIAKIIFEDRKESNPCSLCAKMRKGALNEAMKEIKCNKIAYAHHKDDVVETMLMSLIYEGRIHTFNPVYTNIKGVNKWQHRIQVKSRRSSVRYSISDLTRVFFQKLTMPLKSVEKMAPRWLQRQHSISVTILSDVSQWVRQTDL